MNIAVIEQNKIYRESLGTVLNQINDFNVVYCGDNLDDLIQHHEKDKIALILIDYHLLGQITKLFYDIKIISISDFDEIYPEENLSAKGIAGVIFKNTSKKELEKKIRRALYDNQKHLAPSLLHQYRPPQSTQMK